MNIDQQCHWCFPFKLFFWFQIWEKISDWIWIFYVHTRTCIWFFNFVKGHNFICKQAIRPKFLTYKYNDRTVVLSNFKAVDPTQAELHSLKVEKLDVCTYNTPFHKSGHTCRIMMYKLSVTLLCTYVYTSLCIPFNQYICASNA